MSRTEINRDVLARAALEVLDATGATGLSVEAVASQLGCRTTDVADHQERESLLDLACDQIYSEIDLRPLDIPWPERLRTYARSFRQALLRHPGGAVVLATRPIVSISSMAVAERALTELTTEGFEPEEANRVLLVIVSFVTGHALTELGSRHRNLGGHDAAEVDMFRRHLPAKELPLAAVAVSHVDRDAEFELGLKLIIDGLERQLLHAAP